MAKVDIAFALAGQQPLPADHGYVLYGALSRAVPALHTSNGIGVHPIRGEQVGNRQMSLTAKSRLVLRIDPDHISQVLTLSGHQLDISGSQLLVGVPEVWTLRPATALRSRLVTIKLPDGTDREPFEQAIRRQLTAMGVSTESIVTLGKRRTLRIKDKEVVGYEVVLEGLTAEESLDVHEIGIGGRRHMGCGVFVALR